MQKGSTTFKDKIKPELHLLHNEAALYHPTKLIHAGAAEPGGLGGTPPPPHFFAPSKSAPRAKKSPLRSNYHALVSLNHNVKDTIKPELHLLHNKATLYHPTK